MTLTEGDGFVIRAALAHCAMAWDQRSKISASQFKLADAKQEAAFSAECARLADMFPAPRR